MVFDKTGTLTEGRLRLHAVHVVEGAAREEEVLAWAAAAERTTRHPLADAVTKAAEARGLIVPTATESTTAPGSGVRATVEGRRVAVGLRDWVLAQVGPSSSSSGGGSSSSSSSSSGGGGGAALVPTTQTEVWVGVEGQGVVGRLTLSDSLRSDARAVIASLRGMGMRVMLLSGDSPEAAAAVAAAAGIAPGDARGGVRPEGKAAFVDELRGGGARVAMVGDGVNDAVALGAADVGVAMGGGTDAAGEASSVVLLGDRLGQVVEAVGLGRATLAKIRQNLGLAVVYNVFGIPLAAGALLPAWGLALNPTVAAGMMACSSLAVVGNSLLLRSAAGEGDAAAQAQQLTQQQGAA